MVEGRDRKQRGVDFSGSFYAVEDEIEILDFQFFVMYRKIATTNLHENDNNNKKNCSYNKILLLSKFTSLSHIGKNFCKL